MRKCIYFPGNNDEYLKLISELTSFSSKVNLSESLKKYAEKFLKGKFHLYKEDDNIYCDVSVGYGDKDINLLLDTQKTFQCIRDIRWEERLLIN